MKLVISRLTQTRDLSANRYNHSYYSTEKANTTQVKRASRVHTLAIASNRSLKKNKSDSRSSSLHSLVQTTTFWNKSFNKKKKKINKMLATATNNPNQFNNRAFNSYNNNNVNNKNRGRDFNSNKNNNNYIISNKIPIKNAHRQVIPLHQKKSNPIQIRTNNYQQQQSVSFQNSELTVNLTNNEPRLVIFNNNSNTSNTMNYNNNLPNNNNYRESKFFTTTSHFNNTLNSSITTNNKLFHHSKQRQQPQQADSTGFISNCNNKLIDSYYNCFNNNTKHNKIAVPSSAGFNNKRFNNSRFKYINKSANSSSTKNSAPYNTTQYIMFDYSRRRQHDQQCPNEQQSFTEEWNMALAATEAANADESSHKHASFINTSIMNDNLNEFSLDVDNSNPTNKQLSLSEQNLDLMEQDEPMGEDEEEINEQDVQRMQQLSSSL